MVGVGIPGGWGEAALGIQIGGMAAYHEDNNPLGRPQTPEDIGQLALYLVMAENVTGQAIEVDGGVELH